MKDRITPEFIAAIPKSDLHLHLDGSLRLKTLIELAREAKVKLPSYSEAGLRKLVFKESYKDLPDYLHGFMYTCAVLPDLENLTRVAQELVEDNAADVELTLRAFRRRRVSNPITVARDGEEALDYVYRRGAFAAAAPVPGLILLDLRLPKVDGLEVLRELKSHAVYRNISVVVLTTSAQEEDIKRSYELGAASYIVKPVEFEKFVEVMAQIDVYWILTNVPYPLEESR